MFVKIECSDSESYVESSCIDAITAKKEKNKTQQNACT